MNISKKHVNRTNLKQAQFLFLLLCSNITLVTGYAASEYYVIRNPESQLVLDGSEHMVTIQNSNGSNAQQWMLVPSKLGAFFIINKETRKFLDIDYTLPKSRSYLVTSNRIGTPEYNCPQNNSISKSSMSIDACQQWFIHYEGTIVNICGYFGLDILGADYQAGVKVGTWDTSGAKHQQFSLEHVDN